jgi:hypothetical protein
VTARRRYWSRKIVATSLRRLPTSVLSKIDLRWSCLRDVQLIGQLARHEAAPNRVRDRLLPPREGVGHHEICDA